MVFRFSRGHGDGLYVGTGDGDGSATFATTADKGDGSTRGFGDEKGQGTGTGGGNAAFRNNLSYTGDGRGGGGKNWTVYACTNVRELEACIINTTMRPEYGAG
jgi:hypothetical protein